MIQIWPYLSSPENVPIATDFCNTYCCFQIVRRDRTMEQIVFPVPNICEFLTPESKIDAYQTCERDDQNSKVTDQPVISPSSPGKNINIKFSFENSVGLLKDSHS